MKEKNVMGNVAKEFKEFIMRGNVIDMAVGVIVGAAFNNIVSSLVNDIVMPVISVFTGKINFKDLFLSLDGKTYATLSEAQGVSAPVIAYGNFIQLVLQFLITAFAVFILVKGINKLRRPAPEPEVTTKECPFCCSEISIKATKCPHCASELSEAETDR